MITLKVRFEDLKIGLYVIDEKGFIGVVTEINDRHNVHVNLDNGGSGIYCMEPECEYYDPLYYKTKE